MKWKKKWLSLEVYEEDFDNNKLKSKKRNKSATREKKNRLTNGIKFKGNDKTK